MEGYAFSLCGKSHEKSGTVCQDYSSVHTGENYCFAAVADGVGSCAHSQIGSKTAVESVFKFCEPHLVSANSEKLLQILRDSFTAALQEITALAQKNGHNLHDYDTTLTVALYNGATLLFGHIGDGGLVALRQNGEYELLTNTTKGESWNEVIPLRSGKEQYHFEIKQGDFVGIALFTDGLFDNVHPALLFSQSDPLYHGFLKHFLSADMILDDIPPKDIEASAKAALQSKTCDHLHDDLSCAVLLYKKATVLPPAPQYYDEPDWEGLKAERYYKLYPHLKPKEDGDVAKNEDNKALESAQ